MSRDPSCDLVRFGRPSRFQLNARILDSVSAFHCLHNLQYPTLRVAYCSSQTQSTSAIGVRIREFSVPRGPPDAALSPCETRTNAQWEVSGLWDSSKSSPFTRQKPCSNRKEIITIPSPAGGAFRGHYSEDSGLTTTLERACKQNDVPPEQRAAMERRLVREFARKADLYLPAQDLPDPGDTLEWLSLMQHFGAPTRLLDWTVSLRVALYFAFSRPANGNVRFVWAIDTRWLNERANTLFPGLKKGADRRRGQGGQPFPRALH